jgi:hypothetical protein
VEERLAAGNDRNDLRRGDGRVAGVLVKAFRVKSGLNRVEKSFCTAAHSAEESFTGRTLPVGLTSNAFILVRSRHRVAGHVNGGLAQKFSRRLV